MSTLERAAVPLLYFVWICWFKLEAVAHRPLFGKRNLTLVKMLKFWMIGGLGFGINLAVLYTVTELVGLWYMTAAVFALFAAATSNFILNALWTFKEPTIHNPVTDKEYPVREKSVTKGRVKSLWSSRGRG